jgi:hypothetical protein
MPKIELKIEGKKLRFFNNFSFSDQIDTISGGVSFTTFQDFETFDYKVVEAFRDGILIFTGEIIGKDIPETSPPEPFTYRCESLTHILSCTLPTEAYPLQLENSTLKDIVEYICGFFDLEVVFDQSASAEASGQYKLSDLKLAESASSIINELVTQVGCILSHDANGRLIVTKNIEQNQITLPRYLSNNKSFNLKDFYHNYIALGQAPVGEDADIQAIARFSNIDDRRNITKIQDSGGIDTIEKKAEGMRSDSLKSIDQGLNFTNFFCNIGDFIKIGDNKLIINQLNYTYNSGGEAASISVVDSQVYER